MSKSGTRVAIFTYANTYTGGTTVLDGTLIVNGVQAGSPVTVMSGTVSGTGLLGALDAYSGMVIPGTSPGVLRAGSTLLTGGVTFRVELNGSSAGFGYDQLDVTGTVDLGGATLNATLAYVPANNQQFTIIRNDSNDAVVGTFAGLPQGSTLMIGGRSFTISYTGGSGSNDVVLTNRRSPGTFSALGCDDDP